MKVFVLFVVLLLSGCAHDFTVSNMEGAVAGEGVAQEISHELSIALNGKLYSGQWAFDSFSRMGKGFAVADDGDTVTCDFLYREFKGMGSCEDKDGKKYSVKVHN